MAISKIILNGVTQMDVTQDTVTAEKLLPSYTATKNNGMKISGEYEPSSESDTINGILEGTISGIYENSRVSIIGNGVFRNTYSLTSISFEKCKSIGSRAFQNCSNLTAISFPSCTNIYSYAFYLCSNLTNAYFPECVALYHDAFANCANLASAVFPKCTGIDSYAFGACSMSLSYISFPKCTYINESAFQLCSSLATAYFPACLSIGASAFKWCVSLSVISFPACTTIAGGNNFYVCRTLLSAYFLGSKVPTLAQSNAFSSTPIAGYTDYTDGVLGSIFVKESMLTSFQTATNWTTYSSRMVGLTDAEIEALSV